jgi:hypothetical protein
MRQLLASALVIVISIAGPMRASATPNLFGGSESGGELYRFSPSGAIGPVNNIGVTLDGLAFKPTDGFLYGAWDQGQYISRIAVSPTIASVWDNFDIGVRLDGLTFNTGDNLFYGPADSSTLIYRVFASATGAGVVSSFNVGVRLDGIAYNPLDGLLYGAGENNSFIYRINPNSGTIISSFDIGVRLDGVTFNIDDGWFYGTNESGPVTRFVTSGATQTISGPPAMDSIAYIPIPEPSTCTLFVLGGLMVATSRYRSRR